MRPWVLVPFILTSPACFPKDGRLDSGRDSPRHPGDSAEGDDTGSATDAEPTIEIVSPADGAYLSANVDLTAELVNMMTAQRNYQANAQTIKTQDQIMSTLVNLR